MADRSIEFTVQSCPRLLGAAECGIMFNGQLMGPWVNFLDAEAISKWIGIALDDLLDVEASLTTRTAKEVLR